MLKLTYGWAGWKKIKVSQENTPKALDICRRRCLAYADFAPLPEGGITFCMKLPTAKVFLALCQAEEIEVEVLSEGGCPRLLGKLFHRFGLWMGGILAVVLVVLSTTVVWDVRVRGNTTLTAEEVKASLAYCGFDVGTSLWGFAADKVQNRVLIHDKRLAWVSINMRGTVGYVEVVEAVYPTAEDTTTPTNLLATMDGQIVRVELTRGNVLVHEGQWVSAGDLLVSGVYDSQQVGIRYTHAKAKVYAKTVQQMNVEIPLRHEEIVYADQQDMILLENALVFFKNKIKFSNKTRNIDGFYDIIRRETVPFSNLGIGFPISFVQTWCRPYTLVEATYTYAEAEELAYRQLAEQIAQIQGGAEVLSKTITTTHKEDALLLSCTLVCLQDIAKEQVFEVAW